MVLLPASPDGRDLAPRLAVVLGRPLLAGAVAARIGAPLTLAIRGSLCIAGALWFASQLPKIRSVVRPIYVRLNIISEAPPTTLPTATLGEPPEI